MQAKFNDFLFNIYGFILLLGGIFFIWLLFLGDWEMGLIAIGGSFLLAFIMKASSDGQTILASLEHQLLSHKNIKLWMVIAAFGLTFCGIFTFIAQIFFAMEIWGGIYVDMINTSNLIPSIAFLVITITLPLLWNKITTYNIFGEEEKTGFGNKIFNFLVKLIYLGISIYSLGMITLSIENEYILLFVLFLLTYAIQIISLLFIGLIFGAAKIFHW